MHWVLPRVKLSRDRGCWQWVVRMMQVWVYKLVFSSVVAVSIHSSVVALSIARAASN